MPIFFFIIFNEYQSKKPAPTFTPGAWSRWAPWGDCTKSCGIGVRRRIRFCSYSGNQKERRCKGSVGQMKNCDTKVACPIHGGWNSWVAWGCTVTCGGGDGEQRRRCTNPKPMFGGKVCEGPAEEKGRCNTQKCPDQVYTLSPMTAQAIKNSIDNDYHNLEKNEAETVKIPCSTTAIAKIYDDYPKTTLIWTKNGQILKVDHDRMDVTPTELTIMKLKSNDSGVYVCSVQYVPQVVKPVTVAALSVRSAAPDIKIPAEQSINIICHGAQLAKIYKNVTQKWLINDHVYKDFGSSSPVENNMYEVDDIKKNMSGKWSCIIKDQLTNKRWTTNVVFVKVLPAVPRFFRFLSNRNVLLTFLILLFILLMLVGTVFGYIIIKTREDFMAEFEKWSQIVKWEEIKAGGVPSWALSSGDEITMSDDTETEDEI